MSQRRTALFVGILAAALAGAAAGLGVFTLGYAETASYLTNDSKACGNCHVMQGHLDAWVKSSHSKFAGCNDCHAPHDSLVNKYYCKARNGFFHSLAFTTGNYPDNLQINNYNRRVTENTCRSCHSSLVHGVDPIAKNDRNRIQCIGCHSTVGHDR